MMLLEKIAKALKYLGRQRIILDRVSQEPYLERYYVFLKDRNWFPFNIFLHRFLKSDPLAHHDHPWNYTTIVLSGGYWEYVPRYNDEENITGEKKLWRGPGHIRRCKAERYHRIEIEPGIDCWTMFIPGKKCREWGFLDHDGSWQRQHWVHNEEYIMVRTNGKN
jgi:hypothetical protein